MIHVKSGLFCLINPLLCFNVLVAAAVVISEFTKQDGRKKRTAKSLCVTNVTGLLLASFVVNFA